jgi:exosortase
MTLRPLRTDRWTTWHGVAAVALACVGVLATYDAWADIAEIAWKDEEYSHIFLVPLVAGWMVWVRRMRIRHCKPIGTILGPILAAIGWVVASYGFYHGYQSLFHAGSVLVVLGCMVAVLGKHLIFRFFPAVAVLIFLIPVPGTIRQQIAVPLQTWTAQIATGMFDTLGVVTERSGNMLVVNGVPVTIAEQCNGVRGIFALVLVSYAFGFGLPLRNSIRFLILLASPLVTIACNVLRVLPTAWMYGHFQDSERYIADKFHEYAGWAMVPAAFLILLAILKVLRWATLPVMRYTLAS